MKKLFKNNQTETIQQPQPIQTTLPNQNLIKYIQPNQSNPQIPKTRTAKLTIILGANGTGKTTLLKHIIAQTRQRVLIITPDDNELNEKDAAGNSLYPITELKTKNDFIFSGVRRHIFDPKYTLKVIDQFKKGIIIFDDCRVYFPARTDNIIHKLLIRRRQHELDIIAVGHGFTEVPPKFFTFATDYFLFRTEDNVKVRQIYIKNFKQIEAAQKEVNLIAQTNPHYYKRIKL